MALDPGRIEVGIGLHHRAAGDAIGAQAMQDGPREARRLGHARIGMQRVAVARQPVDQRLVRLGGDVDAGVRRALGHLMRLRRAVGGAAEAAVAAREGGPGQGGQLFAALGVGQHRLDIDDRALARPLVESAQHPAVGLDGGLGGEGLVQLDLLLAVHHHQIVDHLADRRPRAPGDYRGHGRHGLQPALIDEGQLRLVHRVVAQADAQGIEHGLAVAPGAGGDLALQVQNLGIADRHRGVLQARGHVFCRD